MLSFFRGENILVIANNGYASQSFTLPEGRWNVAGSSESFEGVIKMPPLKAAILTL
ncbi:MAG: hypothetical protein SVE93_07430 [Candidatus Thermoplasmatota archaeon]|nr:hypothetical protein [Candidatus Thermoplasmatota archaeon]